MIQSTIENMYHGYAYSYPHKHSYRRMQPLSLESVWESEKKDDLYLYIHIPFCEMRCGFCNLFTIANASENMVDAYLDTLAREAMDVEKYIRPQGFSQMAVGGGTPTILNVPQLEKLFSIVRQLGCLPEQIPVSFEMSPNTVSSEKLALLAENGVDRISIGIQSFIETEVKALGRPQKNKEVYEALDLMRQFPFSTINVDLIYGSFGQTLSSWLYSVHEVINYGAEEVFIYPLYVRPLTGINKSKQEPGDSRYLFYAEARQLLLKAGYTQVSMRMFKKHRIIQKHSARTYSCQEDGMIGMGAGARSYTRTLHYSSEYAVSRQNIRSIIQKYVDKAAFKEIDYGISLGKEEQQRRFMIKSILHGSGLDLERYHTLFNNQALHEYPLLQELIDDQLAFVENGIVRLSEKGFDYSDVIGPALYSEPVRQLIANFELQ